MTVQLKLSTIPLVIADLFVCLLAPGQSLSGVNVHGVRTLPVILQQRRVQLYVEFAVPSVT